MCGTLGVERQQPLPVSFSWSSATRFSCPQPWNHQHFTVVMDFHPREGDADGEASMEIVPLTGS
jgi:hypothetical protein